MSRDQSRQGSIGGRRRRLQSVGALVTAMVLTGVLAWALVVRSPEGDSVDDASRSETDTSQSTGEAGNDGQSSGKAGDDGSSSGKAGDDTDARGDSASSLQQSSDDPGPEVSTVVVGPGEDPAASENLASLTADDVEVDDEIAADDLKELDEQAAAAESAQDSPDAVAEMDSALEEYSSEQESLVTDPEDVEVEDKDPVVLDDLESDADQLNDEIAQSIQDAQDDTQP